MCRGTGPVTAGSEAPVVATASPVLPMLKKCRTCVPAARAADDCSTCLLLPAQAVRPHLRSE